MSPVTTILALARGERPIVGVLGPCRLTAFGGEGYGEEAILDSFRSAPLSLADIDGNVVVAPGHVALFHGDSAIVADICGGWIARLWRLGPGTPVEAEPAVSVPFDPDLAQLRGELLFRAADHPALTHGGEAVATIGRSIASAWHPADGPAPHRTRAFVVRAFDNGTDGAALFAVHRVGPGIVRTSGFSFAAARFRLGPQGMLLDSRIVFDRAGEAAAAAAPWRPRL